MKVFTIGFTQTTAESFFSRLARAGVRRIVDVRLNNVSQLSGFAKRNDLAYFLEHLCGADYVHTPELAPTDELLSAYRKGHQTWDAYAAAFTELLASRRIEETLRPNLREGDCLLCSEAKPHRCHRRLVVEYLQRKWGGIDVVNL